MICSSSSVSWSPGFGLHDASVLMMVVEVVEDQAIADFDEAATEA